MLTALAVAASLPHRLAGAYGLVAQGASVLLIAGACLTVTGVLALVAPSRWLTVGLVLLTALDVLLVWGDRQVAPATTAAPSRPSLRDWDDRCRLCSRSSSAR